MKKAWKGDKDRSKILIINSPNNPTGAVYSEKEIREIVNVCKKHNALILHDNIYGEINFINKKIKVFLIIILKELLLQVGLVKNILQEGID